MQGALHLALYLLGIALILRAARTFRAPGARRRSASPCSLAATDVAYVAPLNSFYAEAATLVFLVLTARLRRCSRCARSGPRRWALPGYLAAAALFVAAKPQNYLLAAAAGRAAARPAAARCPARSRVARARGHASLAWWRWAFLHTRLPWSQPSATAGTASSSPSWPTRPTRAPTWPSSASTPALARFAGVPAFADSIPIEDVTGALRLRATCCASTRAIPGRFLRTASVCAKSAFAWRDPRMGNYTRDSGRPAGTLARAFSAWSRLESLALPRSLPFLVLFLAGVLAVALALAFRQGLATAGGARRSPCAALALAAGMEFGICVVGDGYYDIVKHLYLFQLLFDACLFAAAGRGSPAGPAAWLPRL